jgi:hypothetical protein
MKLVPSNADVASHSKHKRQSPSAMTLNYDMIERRIFDNFCRLRYVLCANPRSGPLQDLVHSILVSPALRFAIESPEVNSRVAQLLSATQVQVHTPIHGLSLFLEKYQ